MSSEVQATSAGTAAVQSKAAGPTASRASGPRAPEHLFEFRASDRSGRVVQGELRAASKMAAETHLRRQGLLLRKLRRRRVSSGRKISGNDVAVFTRQLATMMKAGVPLAQAFDIVGRGAPNPRMGKLLLDIRIDLEKGESLSRAFRKRPEHFNALYCNLVEAGEVGGVLDSLLERLAIYEERSIAIKNKVRSAMMYPTAVLAVAFIVVCVIMIFVVPAFQKVFSSFGADLPAPTLAVIAMSEFFVQWWWAIFAALGGGIYFLIQAWRRSTQFRHMTDRLVLRIPVFGSLLEKSVIARWTRTLATMFSAGVPLVEALEPVGGASGNAVFATATEQIERDVSKGLTLTTAMASSGIFPAMVLQLSAIGEESGSLDQMLARAAEFYEDEVEQAVKGLSSLMEPFIITLLGGIIGGIVVAMYLPIFKIGGAI